MLQPLEKCIFGPVETCWEKKLIAHGKKHMGHGAGRLKKNEFTELLVEVWKEAFTERNIFCGFVTTGIFRVNAEKFPENEFNSTNLKSEKLLKMLEFDRVNTLMSNQKQTTQKKREWNNSNQFHHIC
ncbi:hypothetical protein JTB14_034454 [Gonioctena quinquepunctata]|nr:hypothetical protein JTB14_034454 [Gonioctena quinquepunctata]